MDSKLKAALERARAKQLVARATDEEMLAEYPLLYGMMTETDGLEKGKHRETSTLFVFVKAGVFKACLKDPDASATLWGEGDTLKELLACLEQRLGSDSPDWRVEGPGGQYAKAKGKKGGRGG